MAESEETTQDVEEVTSTEATAEATPSEETTSASDTGTRKERNAAARAAKAKPAAGPRTLEDRLAERAAHKERNARQRRAYRAKQKAKRAEARAAAPEVVEETQHAPEHGPGRPKIRQGIVVSDKADKTVVVRVDIARRHKRYHKILRSSMTLHVHDESNDAHTGDTVRVQECRPMSRTKRWRLLEVLERAR
jgi:small subunit ribosomal protein S17